ncbi:helix-turn-helix domain-containing protein [Streptomyces sp. DT190]|uniref:helix-turn-helix domain-containing protein n=1 Tax=unclassified Streptomyces TaxID=2593676 RepID=UPI003CF68893
MSARTGGARRPYRNDRRAEAAAATRAAILDTALRLFVRHGYAEVTIGDIAREAGARCPPSTRVPAASRPSSEP